MLEDQLAVGDIFVGFSYGKPVPGGGDDLHRLCGAGDQKMYMDVLRKTRIKRLMGLYTSTREDRFKTGQFVWLPYVDGRINWAFPQGHDVVSGYYSGCWMALYKELGANKVAHIVCTDDGDDCKPHWRAHAQNVAVQTMFKPDRHKKGDGDLIFGLVTSTGKRYAITCKYYNPLVKNIFSKQDWIDKFTDEGKFAAHQIEPAADHSAKQKKCNFDQLYGTSVEISGIAAAPNEAFPPA